MILLKLLVNLVRIYEFLILIRCIMSFMRPNLYNPIVRWIYYLTEPVLDAVRRAFPMLSQGGIDFSPIVIIFLLDFTLRYISRLFY